MLKELEEKGEAQEYLTERGAQAAEMYETLEAQMMTSPNLPTDYKQRVAALESIPMTAEEIVLHELIYQPQPSQS